MIIHLQNSWYKRCREKRRIDRKMSDFVADLLICD